MSKANRRRHLWPKKMALDLKALQDAYYGSGAQKRCLISCCGVKRHDAVVGEGRGSGQHTLSASESESDMFEERSQGRPQLREDDCVR